MRTHYPRLLCFFVLLASVAGAHQAGRSPADLPTSHDVILHTELSARTLPPGATLVAGVQLRNVSDHDIDIQDNVMVPGGYHGFRAEVTTLDGRPVPAP